MATTPASTSTETREARFFVGSFLLESLTTGMYVEPRDCIREYVQNGLDAIESARSARLLRPEAGEVRVILDLGTDELRIRDNGISIPPENVWETLTSIGASKKALRRNAGFRGIGRLAGIAYCDTLEFRCKSRGETRAVVLRFNAASIRQALRQGETDIDGAFRTSISEGESIPAPADEHWTEVRMIGLGEAPEELRSVGSLTDYLVSVAPLRYNESWAGAPVVTEHIRENGVPVPTLDVQIGTSEDDLQSLRKPYSDTTLSARRRATSLTDIVFFTGGSTPGRRWWGWYAQTPLHGNIQDEQVAGIRVRVRNIQLDGTEIMTRLFARRGTSMSRLSNWYVGEIFVEAINVIPNARRDGFEDTPDWRELAREIYEQVDPLMDAAYAASRSRGPARSFARINADILTQVDHVEAEAREPAPIDDAEEARRRDRAARNARSKARKFVKRLEQLDLDDYTEDEQLSIREAAVRLREIGGDPRPTPPRQESPPAERSYPPLLDVVFEVLSGVLDTRTFTKAKKALLGRFAEE